MSAFAPKFKKPLAHLAAFLFGTAALGVGAVQAETIHVYLIGGQSNADGRAASSGLPSNLQSAQADVPTYWARDTSTNVGVPTNGGVLQTLAPGESRSSSNFGPEVTFGRSLADYYEGLSQTTQSVALIKFAAGGTNLYSQWAAGGDGDPTSDGAVYQNFETIVRAGLAALKAAHPNATLVIDGIVWVQGESDIDAGSSASAAYEANLTRLIADMRATFSPTMEFMFSRISDNQTVYSSPTDPDYNNYLTLRSGQQSVAATVAGTSLIDTDGAAFTMNSDNLHFNAGGQQALGTAFATAAEAVLSPGFTATGLNWTGATNTAFATATNWSGGTAPADDLTSSYAILSGSPAVNQPAVTADRSAGGLQFGSAGGWTVGGASVLTLGSALIVGTTAHVGIDASALTSGTDTISTSTLRLGSNQTWLVGTGGTLGVTSAVTGNALTFGDDTRGGTLSLSGSTDNAGLALVLNNGLVKLDKASSPTVHAIGGLGLFINGGTAQLTGANGDQIDDSSPIVFNGGTFDLNGRSETIAGLSGSGGKVDNTSSSAAALTVGNGTITAAFSGTITDSGAGALSLTKIGTGTETLSGSNSYAGATTVSNGTLLVNGAHTGAGAYSVGSGATLGGSGTITTAGNAGVTVLSSGKLAPGSSGTTADALTLKLGSGILDLTGAIGGSNSGALVFNLGSSADKLTLATGTLAIGSGLLNFDDFSFATLSGLAAGTYTLFDTSAAISGTLGASLTGVIGGFDATLSLANGNNDIVLTLASISASFSWDTNGTAAGSGSATGTWDSGVSALWTTSATGTSTPAALTTSTSNDLVFSAGTNGTSGTVTVSGTQYANTITLNQAGLTLKGGTISLSGTSAALKVNNSATINSILIAKTITFQTSGQILKLGGGSGTDSFLSGTVGASGASAVIGQSSTLELTNGTYAQSANQTYNIGNVTTGSGGLVIDSGATYTASNSFHAGYGSGTTGLIVLNGGAINQTGSSNMVVGRAGGTGRLIVKSGTLSHGSGSLLIAFDSATGTLDVQGGTVNVGGTLALNAPRATAAAGGTAAVNLTGGVTTVGGIEFGKAAQFTGTATSGSGVLNVKGGSLYIGAAGIVHEGTGTYTSAINLSGGTVGAAADWSSSLNATLGNADGGVTFKAANAAGAAKNITLGGVLSGSGGLTKSGAGILTLTNVNTYTGATTITAGTLSINNAFLSDTSDLFMASGAIFDLNFSASTPDTIHAFYLDGIAQAVGTYGALDSTATFRSSSFTGTGILNVTAIPEPSTWSLLGAGTGMLAILGARRRRSRR